MTIWKRIEEYPKYEISEYGDVVSYHYKKSRVLKHDIDKDGYHHVRLCNNDVQSKRMVHRLVAELFSDPPENYYELTVDHLNHNKDDNFRGNLQWVTSEENLRRAHAAGRYDSVYKRQMTPVMVTDLWSGETVYCDNLESASHHMKVPKSSLYSALHRSNNTISHYTVEYADLEDNLLYGGDWYDYETGLYY